MTNRVEQIVPRRQFRPNYPSNPNRLDFKPTDTIPLQLYGQSSTVRGMNERKVVVHGPFSGNP